MNVIMEQNAELPIYVKCKCNNCGNTWETENWTRKCLKCNSTNINQDAMMRGL